MQRCLVLPVLVLALLVSLAARQVSAEEKFTPAHPAWLVGTPAPQQKTCYIWQGTTYYSDAAHTTWVGLCTITCDQAMHGTQEPTFTGGGTCTGISSEYTVRNSYGCPGICW